jgi:hypothetical protein
MLALLAGCADGEKEPEFRQYMRDAEVEDARTLDGRIGREDATIDDAAVDATQPPREVVIEAWPGARILAHAADGTLLADAEGRATLDAPHIVTVFEEAEHQRVMLSVVAPRGTLRFADPSRSQRVAWPASIQLPGPANGATSYDVTLGCVGVRLFDPMAPFEANVPESCLSPDGIAWVLALALDDDDNAVAFTHGRMTEAPAAPVELGPWRMDFERHTIELDGTGDVHALWGRHGLHYGILGRKQGDGPQFFDLAADFGATHWRAEARVDLMDPPARATLRARVSVDENQVTLTPDGIEALSAMRTENGAEWTAPAAAQQARIDIGWGADEARQRWTILAPAGLGDFERPELGIPQRWRPPEDADMTLIAVRCDGVDGAICPTDAPGPVDDNRSTGWRISVGF